MRPFVKILLQLVYILIFFVVVLSSLDPNSTHQLADPAQTDPQQYLETLGVFAPAVFKVLQNY